MIMLKSEGSSFFDYYVKNSLPNDVSEFAELTSDDDIKNMNGSPIQ